MANHALAVFSFLCITLIFSGSAAAGSLETEAAIRSYLDTLQGDALARSNAYFEGGYWILLWGTLVAVLVDWLFLKFRWSARFRDRAERFSKKRWLQPAIYVIPYTLLSTLLLLPWLSYTGFFREKHYDLMNLSLGEWLTEQAIGVVVSLVLVSIFVIVFFAVIRRFPKNWWVLGTAVTATFLLLVITIAPVYIAPLFNDYKQMEAGDLRDQIVAMADAEGVPSENIYVFDQSKQHDRISANVSGFANTMRISLNDNLLLRSTPAEVKAVMGHELGHYVLGHVWRLVIVLSLVFGLGFFVLAKLTPKLIDRYGQHWGIRSLSDPAVIPLFGIILSLFFLLMTPVTNSIIRINEVEADAYGLEVAKEPEGFASIAMKLSEYRKIE
ncbi:MAG: M48 family metalloprotease, partial [Pseudomonadota bacterium]